MNTQNPLETCPSSERCAGANPLITQLRSAASRACGVTERPNRQALRSSGSRQFQRRLPGTRRRRSSLFRGQLIDQLQPRQPGIGFIRRQRLGHVDPLTPGQESQVGKQQQEKCMRARTDSKSDAGQHGGWVLGRAPLDLGAPGQGTLMQVLCTSGWIAGAPPPVSITSGARPRARARASPTARSIRAAAGVAGSLHDSRAGGATEEGCCQRPPTHLQHAGGSRGCC